MPWTKNDYPNAFKNLPEDVRDKAIEIGNALLDERDMEEGIAIATAISRAKDWAAERGLPVEDPEHSRITDVKEHGEDRFVVPHGDEWAVKVEGKDKVERTYHTKKEAVKQARKEAKDANATLTIQRKTGQVEKRISYNPKNKGPIKNEEGSKNRT
jgi:uncharacterized protein YdaT